MNFSCPTRRVMFITICLFGCIENSNLLTAKIESLTTCQETNKSRKAENHQATTVSSDHTIDFNTTSMVDEDDVFLIYKQTRMAFAHTTGARYNYAEQKQKQKIRDRKRKDFWESRNK